MPQPIPFDKPVARTRSYRLDLKLLLARVPGLVKYHRHSDGMIEPCDDRWCESCCEGVRTLKAYLYFVATARTKQLSLIAIDDRINSWENDHAKRVFKSMLKSPLPEDRLFIALPSGVAPVTNFGLQFFGDPEHFRMIDEFSTSVERDPEALLSEYFYRIK